MNNPARPNPKKPTRTSHKGHSLSITSKANSISIAFLQFSILLQNRSHIVTGAQGQPTHVDTRSSGANSLLFRLRKIVFRTLDVVPDESNLHDRISQVPRADMFQGGREESSLL